MGFVTGFTGGAALTLSVAYLTILSHQRNRERQCNILRLNAGVIKSLATSDPIAIARLSSPTTPGETTQLLYYTSPEIPRHPRTSFTDELKARWNAEVRQVVSWVQNKDWAGLREDAEAAASYLWSQSVSNDKVVVATTTVKQTTATVTDSVVAKVQKNMREGVAIATSSPDRVPDTTNKQTEIEAALKKRYNHEDGPAKSVGELLEERYQHKA